MTVRSLQAVDFFDAKNRPVEGLVSVQGNGATSRPDEHAALLQAATFEHVDYVYFRRFNDGRTSQIAAYVVDNTRGHLSETELARLHHKLWLHGVAPLVYVAGLTRVDILSCSRKPDFWTDRGTAEYRPAVSFEVPIHHGREMLQLAAIIDDELAEKRRRFSAHRLADGTFWDDPANHSLANEGAAAHKSLIQAIVEVDVGLDGAKHPVRRRLLVLMVLIKYLEDRGVFPRDLFGRFLARSRSFLDILQHGSVADVRRLLRYFEKRFNGDVFSLGDAADSLDDKGLRRFAKLVEGKTLAGQQHFWNLFDFKYIPVEVISRLYQRFVAGHGAVYTPPVLASLLLDFAMPYETLSGSERVLDPSCGSGIFLVGAFKRLVTFWRSRNRWMLPTAETLKEILRNSIYGVELEETAVDLTAFSLSLAICDALEPPVIWSDLKFDKLRGRNLREGDFFDPATFAGNGSVAWPEKFDVIVGNPPFKSELTAAAARVEAVRAKIRTKNPDNQAASLFLETSLLSLTPGGRLCLLQNAGLLYNSRSGSFCKHLMELATLDAVLDFVSIRGMFDGADPKTIAWFATKTGPKDDSLRHLTFRRTFSSAQQIGFELDHYDWNSVPRKHARENPFVWRAGLLGGGRLYELSLRFQRMRNLAEYVSERGWEYGEGFIIGKGPGRSRATHLTGQAFLPTRSFLSEGINAIEIRTVTETHFDTPCRPELFIAPLLLIKEHLSLPVAFWEACDLTFQDSIVGIHAPQPERDDLFSLFQVFSQHRRFFQFCCVLNGTKGLVGKATAIQKQDIDKLPYPEDVSDLELSFWEDAIKEDVLNYLADFVRLGQDSELLSSRADSAQIVDYSALFCRMLGSIYRNLKSSDPVFLNGLIAQPFYFGSKPDVSWLAEGCEDAISRLVYHQCGESLRTVRVVRIYESNVLLIVKPDRLRYWIPSTAIRDADETLVDLRQQGW